VSEASGTLNPADEFEHALHPISVGGHELSFHIWKIDLSITTVVLYLWFAALIVAVLFIGLARVAKLLPDRKQVAIESLYEFIRDGLVGAVMPAEVVNAWFPYIATLFTFILFSNLIGLIPIPLSLVSESWARNLPEFKTYAATSNLNVTLAMAIMTFVLTHYSGMKHNGALKYYKNWVPGSAPGVLKPLLFVLHGFSEMFRVVSLSVRLWANMLAGHIVILVFYSLIFMLSVELAFLAILIEGGVVAVSLFEIFVAAIQAFIFAVLSAVYIGGAIHQEH
jgi:F-type H+-transporting ATPase subunit a